MTSKIGIYQITGISDMDAYYKDRESLIGRYFTFATNCRPRRKADGWSYCGPGVNFLLSEDSDLLS